jgi:hypothetical protein
MSDLVNAALFMVGLFFIVWYLMWHACKNPEQKEGE